MKKLSVIVLLAATITLGAPQQTWTGKISDNVCGAKHDPGEGAEPQTDAECTIACIRGGSKYVLVSGDKIYKIANQDDADLPKTAGKSVKVTGELKGDTITISKIEPAGD